MAGAEHRAIGALRRPVRAQERQTSRIIGVLLIVGGLAVDYGGKAVQDAIADPYLRPASAPVSMPGQRPVDHGLPDMPLMGGLIAFVLAHVFAHGMPLREDVEATI